MAIQEKNTLKSYFNTGDRPTEAQFGDLIDSTVLKVNSVLPDNDGNVQIDNISGTAGTITGNISTSQVTGLQAELDAKLDPGELKTVNGTSIIGTGNIAINLPVIHLVIPNADYTVQANGNVFDATIGKFTLAANKTYRFKGRYIVENPGAVSRSISMAWGLSQINVVKMDYAATVFTGTANTTGQTTTYVPNTAARNLYAASTAAMAIIDFEGILRCTTAGTLIPRMTFTSPGTNIVKMGSYLQFEELGSNTLTNLGSVGPV